MQALDILFSGRLKLTSTIFICLLFLSGIQATKICINENEKFPNDLKTCLSTLVKKLCNHCTTLHLVIPAKSTWQADALASHFSNSSETYAIVLNTMDRLHSEHPSFDRLDIYLVNAEADLKMALELLSRTQPGRSCVVLVNFHLDRSLGGYLQHMISVGWKGRNKRHVVFAALIEGNVQVFGTALGGSEISKVGGLQHLDICDTNGPIESNKRQPKSIVTVVVHPSSRPYVDRRTDNPGGVIGEYMKVLEKRLNITTRYVWPVNDKDILKYAEGDGQLLIINLQAEPKTTSKFSTTFLESEGVWVIVTPDSFVRRNSLALPFKNGIYMHLVLLTIYTIAMVYFSGDLDKTKIILRLFGMFFGNGVGWLPRKAVYRCLVILWCFTTYNVLVQAYLATVTSELSIPMKHKFLRDTEDLIKSGFDIVCTEIVMDFYCDLDSSPDIRICDKCGKIEDNSAYQQFVNNTLTSTGTWRSFAFPIESKLLASLPYSKFVTSLTERIGSWPGMIYSNAHTEIFPIVINTTQRLTEAGITGKWMSQYSRKNVLIDEYASKILNMGNLNGIFVILYIGWSCSIIVFLIELSIKWYRK